MNINKRTIRCGGFSLTEMLIATGIMAIGLVLVATIFPVGVKLTTMSTERSIAAVAADEAFAKVQLYGLRSSVWPATCSDFKYVADFDEDADGVMENTDLLRFNSGVYNYPSDPTLTDTKYCWSAVCRGISSGEFQVTVFVNRMMMGGLSYYACDQVTKTVSSDSYPQPVLADLVFNANNNDPAPPRELVIDLSGFYNQKWETLQPNSVFSFFDEGYTIVNWRDGRVYQIEEMLDNSTPKDGVRETIVLRQDWKWNSYDFNPFNPPTTAEWARVWIVPPGVGSSRYPCVGVYQKVMRFD